MASASLVCTISSDDSDNSNNISDDSDSDMEIITDIDPKVKPRWKLAEKKPGQKPASKRDESDPDDGNEYDPATCGAFAYLGYHCENV